ncbi:mitochondrial outer membrane translocase complex, subunit Tom22 [Myxozyma melibiosi]|uniref:Mitochondrial outer membrane translocase complex, subunit Tom22 n=1 Tax=Myxozyma melibiosi TaxID=54550 RepID=A0ABR1EZE7_9ASCO
MVQITPVSVTDEKAGAPYEDRDEDYSDISDNESVASLSGADSDDDDDDYLADETLADRIVALKEIIAPQYRPYITSFVQSTVGWVDWTLSAGWSVTTGVLFLGSPLAIMLAGNAAGSRQDLSVQAQESSEIIAPGASL